MNSELAVSGDTPKTMSPMESYLMWSGIFLESFGYPLNNFCIQLLAHEPGAVKKQVKSCVRNLFRQL